MPHYRGHQSRIFWGLVLILVGGLFLLDRLGGLDFGEMMSTYWPVILIILGFSILVSSGFRRSLGGFLVIIVGVIFLLSELGVLEAGVWSVLWPILIIIVGFWLLVRPAIRMMGEEKFPELKESDIDVSAVFGGVRRRVATSNFRGGRVSAVMGGAEIDLTGAGLEGGKATLTAEAIMGGIEIRLSRDWRVVIDGAPILGSIEDKRRNVPEGESKGTLYVRGTAILGGITIKD